MLDSSAGALSSRDLPDPASLIALFEPSFDLRGLRRVEASEVPLAARRLLDHTEHMTETLEAWCGAPVRLVPLEVVRQGTSYARRLRLESTVDGTTIMWGLMRIQLDAVAPPVAARILAADRPLGRILIESGILRSVELLSLWRISAETMRRLFGFEGPEHPFYGRIARIHCDRTPAVELLEIVAPPAEDQA